MAEFVPQIPGDGPVVGDAVVPRPTLDFGSIGSVVDAVSDRIGQQVEQQAVERQTVRGREAGERAISAGDEPEIRTDTFLNPAAKAFNDSARTVYAQRREIDALHEMDKIAVAHPLDPGEVKRQTDKIVLGSGADLDPETAGAVMKAVGAARDATVQGVGKQTIDHIISTNTANWTSGYEEKRKAFARTLKSQSDASASAKSILGLRTIFAENLVRDAEKAWRNGIISPAAYQAIRDNAYDDLTQYAQQAVEQGIMDTAPSMEAAVAGINNVRNDIIHAAPEWYRDPRNVSLLKTKTDDAGKEAAASAERILKEQLASLESPGDGTGNTSAMKWKGTFFGSGKYKNLPMFNLDTVDKVASDGIAIAEPESATRVNIQNLYAGIKARQGVVAALLAGGVTEANKYVGKVVASGATGPDDKAAFPTYAHKLIREVTVDPLNGMFQLPGIADAPTGSDIYAEAEMVASTTPGLTTAYKSDPATTTALLFGQMLGQIAKTDLEFAQSLTKGKDKPDASNIRHPMASRYIQFLAEDWDKNSEVLPRDAAAADRMISMALAYYHAAEQAAPGQGMTVFNDDKALGSRASVMRAMTALSNLDDPVTVNVDEGRALARQLLIGWAAGAPLAASKEVTLSDDAKEALLDPRLDGIISAFAAHKLGGDVALRDMLAKSGLHAKQTTGNETADYDYIRRVVDTLDDYVTKIGNGRKLLLSPKMRNPAVLAAIDAWADPEKGGANWDTLYGSAAPYGGVDLAVKNLIFQENANGTLNLIFDNPVQTVARYPADFTDESLAGRAITIDAARLIEPESIEPGPPEPPGEFPLATVAPTAPSAAPTR